MDDSTAATLARDLPRAIERKQLHVRYQPKVSLFSHQLLGFEALVRWDHPEFGLVPPDFFIPVAETMGEVGAIGDFVRGRALSIHRRHRNTLPIAINVSANEIGTPGFAKRFMKDIIASGVDPSQIHVEITETGVIDSIAVAEANLLLLRAAGILVALDDFGKGNSSLTMLHRLPIDCLKLDKGFTDTVTIDQRAAHMVETVVRMAQGLGMSIVAEGVEDNAQATLLSQLGADIGQGYLFGRPMLTDDALALIESAA